MREEIPGLVKSLFFIKDGEQQNQIKSNFIALKLCYLHPEIIKMLRNFIMSEIMTYFTEEEAADEEARKTPNY